MNDKARVLSFPFFQIEFSKKNGEFFFLTRDVIGHDPGSMQGYVRVRGDFAPNFPRAISIVRDFLRNIYSGKNVKARCEGCNYFEKRVFESILDDYNRRV